jgi:hypothetical protein
MKLQLVSGVKTNHCFFSFPKYEPNERENVQPTEKTRQPIIDVNLPDQEFCREVMQLSHNDQQQFFATLSVDDEFKASGKFLNCISKKLDDLAR